MVDFLVFISENLHMEHFCEALRFFFEIQQQPLVEAISIYICVGGIFLKVPSGWLALLQLNKRQTEGQHYRLIQTHM